MSNYNCLTMMILRRYHANYGELTSLINILLPVGIYWLAVLILGVLELVRSFKVYKTGDAAGCVNGMLIHKYGLVIFFAVNFIVMFLFYFILTLGTLVGTRGFALFAAPFLLPWLAASVAFSVFASWLAIVPGAFYGIQVIRITYREKKTGIGAAIWHGILQFVFLVFWRAFFLIFVAMIPYNQRCIFMRFYRISMHYRKFKDAFAPLTRLKSLTLR